MPYKILGVHVNIVHSDVQPGIIDPLQYVVNVAWQSNQPSCRFMWRCTMLILDHYPTEADIQHVAARGSDNMDKVTVRKLFPHLPGRSLTD